MARVVVTTWGSYGDVNPYLALGVALRERGHEAVMAMPAIYGPAITGAGFAHAITEPDADPELDPQLLRRVMHPRHGAEAIFREVLMPFLEESHASVMRAAQGADLIVSHPAAITTPMVAEQLGVRWLSSVLSPLNFMSAFDPILPPPASFIRHVPWSWRLYTAPWIADAGRKVAARWMEPLQRFRESKGLRRVENPLFEGMHSPYGVLAMYSRVFGGPFRDWPARTTITGQLRYDSSFGGASLDPELDAFLQAGEPPVVFTLGSSVVMIAEDFWDQSLAAAKQLGVRAVMLAGPVQAPRIAAMAPSTVLAVPQAPHSLLFPRASIIVHPCGVGTTGTALFAGVPQLAVPFANDQPDNANRLERLGVARAIYPGEYRTARVVDVLRALQRDSRYAQRARDVGAIVASERGAETACDVIERVLSEPQLGAR